MRRIPFDWKTEPPLTGCFLRVFGCAADAWMIFCDAVCKQMRCTAPRAKIDRFAPPRCCFGALGYTRFVTELAVVRR